MSLEGLSQPLLIVNADDLGYEPSTTDAILEVFRRGAISSATAMVYMADSERAAARARESGLPVGLHLNLSESFTDRSAPEHVAERQRWVTRRFGPFERRLRRWIYDPTIQRRVEDCIRDQLGRFEALYGSAPTHVDGHKHVHVSPNVLLARALARGTRLRNTIDLMPRRPRLLDPGRSIRRRLIHRKYVSTEHLLPLEERMEEALALADRTSLEVMTHPADPRDFDILVSSHWRDALARHRLGSFAELRPHE